MSNFASEAGHWYTKDGKPAYETIGANGNLRKTTLRDARKHAYVPGVSDIIKCAASFELERWKVKQAIRTTLSLPYNGEEAEAYVDRVYVERDRQGREVMDLGSAIHGAIELSLKGKYYAPGHKLHNKTHLKCALAALDTVGGWCGIDGVLPERSFAHPLGFGGKCDIHKRGFVADFKSKDFDEEETPTTYDNHAMQLAAYREGFKMPDACCAIIYVSTKVPGLTRLVEVGQDELDRGWELFCALLTYWKIKNRYEPKGT